MVQDGEGDGVVGPDGARLVQKVVQIWCKRW